MSLRALLVTKDDQAVETLAPVLQTFGLAVHCCGYPDAVCLVSEQKFQSVLVDFDDPHSATLVLDSVRSVRFESHALTIALLADKRRVRNVFGAGANFILYKPVTQKHAEGTLRAAASLIWHDRCASVRVAVQVPVKLSLHNNGDTVEGILLDLSEHGMGLLAAQPLYSPASLRSRFALPGFPGELELRGEVEWANPNGESGVRFTDMPESLSVALRRWLENHRQTTQTEEPAPIADSKLTDLSLGGCYVETLSPLPEHAGVSLKLWADGRVLEARGQVRVMHPSQGMGIEFDLVTAEERLQTAAFIRFLGNRPGIEPELLAFPRSLRDRDQRNKPASVGGNLEDPLLELLRNHESFTQERFLEALNGLRKPTLARAR